MRQFHLSYCFQNLKQLKLVVLLMSLFTAFSAWGQDVTPQQAECVAADFFKRHGVCSETVIPQKAKRKIPTKTGANSPYYIFNSGDASAFVVVSGDSRTQQVLAYSTDNAFDEDNVAPGAKFFLDMYESHITALQNAAYTPAKTRAALYPDEKGVRLKTALWNQSATDFWGSKCPTINGEHTYAGCVATAMGILMRYYEWANGSGSKGYTQDGLDFQPNADFGGTSYDISSIPTNNDGDNIWSDKNKDDVATLLYHCGVAANVNYGEAESGAVLNSAMIGLYRYFGYTLGHSIAFDGNIEEWVAKIKNEIDGGNPVLYEGQDNKGGHAFVCEGYDNENRLYFNYGWSGKENGYYTIWPEDSNNYPADLNLFPNCQYAKIGIRPYKEAAPRTLSDVQISSMSINGNDKIRIGQAFYVNFNGVTSVADKALNCVLGVFLCKGDGSDKSKLGQFGVDLELNTSYSYTNGYYTIPYGTRVSEGDYLALYSSLDNGTTWQDVECYDKKAGRIMIADAFDLTPQPHFKMYKNGENTGLQLINGNVIIGDVLHYSFNIEGKPFAVAALKWFNILNDTFDGEVAVFLCDNNGNRILKVGSGNFRLDSGAGYNVYYFTCTIPSGTELVAGDNLRLFSCYQNEDTWMPVECEVPEKGYISIPLEFVPESKSITFSNLYTTFCSRNALDFSGITTVYAYKATEKDAQQVILEKVEKVKGGEGILLRKMTEDENEITISPKVIQGEAELDDISDNLFVGVLTECKVTQDASGYTNYVLGRLNDNVGFYKVGNDGMTVGAGKAYLSVPETQDAPQSFAITFSDDITGIIEVGDGKNSDDPGNIYNIQGVKVNAPGKGIYIINGKKFIKR